MKTISRPTPALLACYIGIMADRMASARADQALHSALFVTYKNEEDREKRDRYARSARRRRMALQRLTEALRKQADAT